MVQRETGANWQEKIQVMIGWVQYNTSLGPNQLHHREVCSTFYLLDLISSTNDRGIYSKQLFHGYQNFCPEVAWMTTVAYCPTETTINF